MSDNMPILWQNALMQFGTEVARKPIWGWAIVMGTMFWLCVLAVAVL